MISTRTKIVAIVVCILILCGLVAALLIHGNKDAVQAPQPTTSYSSPKPVAVSQPPSAKDVADSLHGTDYHRLGPVPAGGVVDSGWFMIDDQKYAVDTFENKEIRDQWLETAMKLGVAPKWETNTSVTYPSVGE